MEVRFDVLDKEFDVPKRYMVKIIFKVKLSGMFRRKYLMFKKDARHWIKLMV